MIREPFEPPSVKNWALIIHADSSGERVDVYWADIEAGREGLRLAREVKAWRRRDDLLTIGRRLRIAIPPIVSDDNERAREPFPPVPVVHEPPEPEPEMPALPAGEPVEASRVASRREYLTGRVRAILGHSETASKALARAWPEGVPGLKREGHTWEQLEAITAAVEVVEKDHSVPFYATWDDPAQEEAKLSHPSNVWAMGEAATAEDRETIGQHILDHPRGGLARRWIRAGIGGGINKDYDTAALAHALTEFLNLDANKWNDEDLTLMLDGSLRALGYQNGIVDLGRFNPEHAPLLMSAAFAITAGNAYLLFDENEKPIVRTNIRKG